MAEMAYCVKCRAKTEMVDAERVTMKNGRPAMKGKCAKCGTGMYKILPTKQGLILKVKEVVNDRDAV